MKETKAVTYSLLAHIRNSGTLMKGPVDVFIPLIKRALHKLNHGGVLKSNSILEIQNVAFDLYTIDFPLPVLRIILNKIASEINTESSINFQLHIDDSFILKDFYFEDFEEKIQESKRDVETIEKLFAEFVRVNSLEIGENNSIIKFIEKNKVSISKYISNYHSKNGNDFTIEAKFIEYFKQVPSVYEIIRRLYLGSIISGFLEFKTTSLKSDVELLFDTNFIISLIDLNTPESTHTCNKLLDICKNLGYKFTILSDTIDEIKFLLTKKAENFSNTFLVKKVNPEDIYNACDRRKLNRNDLERIVDNIEFEIRSRGIIILPYTDNIKNKAKFSREYEIFKEFRNSKTSALHDATAIYYVRDIRKKKIKEFENVNCWFVNNSTSQRIDGFKDEEYNIEFQSETIRADELLNILWLSNPSINQNLDNEDLIDIGITSIVAFTLNDSLPKASIIKELDENIQKYRNDTISDKDILLISSRICNRQLKDIAELNSLANKDNKEDFVNRLKVEANKEELEEKKRIGKLDLLLVKFEKQIANLDKERSKHKGFNETFEKVKEKLDFENSNLISQLDLEKKARITANNKLKKIARDKFIRKKIIRWRLWVALPVISLLLIFLVSVLITLRSNSWDISLSFNQIKAYKEWDSFSSILPVISFIVTAFFIPVIILRFFNVSNIEAYKKTIDIPQELQDEIV